MQKRAITLALAALLTTAVGCESKSDTAPAAKVEKKAPEAAKKTFDRSQLAAFKPLPDSFQKGPVNQARVDLGRQLYYDARFSKNHDISCNSCHGLDTFGVDNEATSPGHKGQRGDRNSPTVYNAAAHVAQFWDGRAADVEAQAQGPVLNPVEMALKDAKAAEAVLKSIPQYVESFKKAFPDDKNPVSFENMANAIGAFERGLTTPAPWDDFLAGNDNALSDAEKAGLENYLAAGCQTCHNGAAMGGGMYQKLGLAKPWPKLEDEGRAKVTGNAAEKHFFKVPSLRNITKTGPYLHDGSVADLGEMVRLMSEHQLGRALTPEQVSSITTFLGALEGKPDANYIKKPELPASTKKTPKPDPS